MGVKLKELISDIVQYPDIKDFDGKRVAIDAFNWLYSFLSSIRQFDGESLMDSEGHTTSHLSGFFYRSVFLIENGIKPVYVWDGQPSVLKAETVAKRIEIREDAKKKAEIAKDAGNYADAKKFAQASSRIEPFMIPQVKELLNLMGIPYIEAPGEGEAQAALMVNEGKVEYAVSQDYDCFLFGAKRLLRNLTQQKFRTIRGKRYPINIEAYTLDNVLAALEISRDQLVDLGILSGTDFNDGIKGIGVKTALKLVKDHGTIEDIYKDKPELEENLTIDHVKQVRKIFLHPRVTSDYVIEYGSIKIKDVLAFLTSHDFNPDRIKVRLGNLARNLKERKAQRSLSSFL